MTTKPKAKKYRIKRNASGGAAQAPAEDVQKPTAHPANSAPAPTQTVGVSGQVDSPKQMNVAEQLDAIKQEGLTGRQLRMARRIAQKHGMAPTSDFDAVRLLREKGVDPFQQSNLLQLVQQGQQAGGQQLAQIQPQQVQLPQTVDPNQQMLPSTDVSPADRRAVEIKKIQKDIAKRRRRKFMLLMSRLAAFVFLPTILAGYYYYAVATPMYSTKSEFLILTADGGTGGAGGFFGGTAFATGQDSIATQSYLESKDAMLRLDKDVSFVSHFSQESIDPIQRLEKDATNEAAYKLYKKYVKLGYDPTEGVIRMELSTADPALSESFSRALIEYAEERVDQLSREKRVDAVRTAEKGLEDAKEERRLAQQRLVQIQETTILDPAGEVANIRNLIGNAELQLQEKTLALKTQLNNSRPNAAKVEALRSEIEVLEEELTLQNDRLNKATEGDASLASQSVDIQMAQADLATADLVLQSALEAKRQSDVEANKQVRYLTVSVEPVASESPSYPRSFENTALAFLIFSGIYLVISLTASVLREQVST